MQAHIHDILSRAICSGSAAGLASAAAATSGAMQTGHRPYAAVNAVTHCLWRDASRQEAPSVKYTALGAAIHMGSAVFWGVLFEALCDRRSYRSYGSYGTYRRDLGNSTATIASAAATTAVVAYFVDYHAVPKRLTPGYEAHLSKRSLAMTYVALGAGFAIAALLRRRR